ncbi:hypothetical protein [Algoriphagus persicinus]|uniref:hypothetical protein n=1 Tax=Algoriphagus persicinus TaxID=3108754 RepID=UPI002B409474|nr:hypothetical protein [Algoriphagus sp. E1-3-M2]
MSLLIAFFGVFICDFFCDFGMLDMRINSFRSGDTAHLHESGHKHDHSGQSGDHHHIKPDGEVAHQHEHNYTANHHHKSNDKDECCEEETSQLLASLVKNVLQNSKPKKYPLCST